MAEFTNQERPQPPQETREQIAARLLHEHGITGRGAHRLSLTLVESVSDQYVRGLLSIQRPPGYESDLAILARFSPRLALKANFGSAQPPDFTTNDEIVSATLALRHLKQDGDPLWINRKNWQSALDTFLLNRKTAPFIKSLLRDEGIEMVRNSKIAFLLASLTIGGYKSAFWDETHERVLDQIYPKLKAFATVIIDQDRSLAQLGEDFFGQTGEEMHRTSRIFRENIAYEDWARLPIDRANDVLLETYLVIKEPEAFAQAAKEFYRETVKLDVDTGARFLKENGLG